MATPYLTYDQVSAQGYKGQFTYTPPPAAPPNLASLPAVRTIQGNAPAGFNAPKGTSTFYVDRQNNILGYVNPTTGQDVQTVPNKAPQVPQPKGMARVMTDIGHAGIAAGKGLLNADAAIVHPLYDVATGKGGQAVHDTAQLSSDISGGTINQFAEAARYTPNMVAADVTANPKAQASTQQKAFGTTNQGSIAKKIIASTAGTASMFVGGGEAAPVARASVAAADDAARFGVRSALTQSAKLGLAGAIGNAASTVNQNPNATRKQIAESAAMGGALGAAIPVAGRVVGKALGAAIPVAGRVVGKALGNARDVSNIPEGETVTPFQKAVNEGKVETPSEPAPKVTEPAKGQAAPTETTPKTAKTTPLNESGSVNVKPIQDMVEKHQKLAGATEDVTGSNHVRSGQNASIEDDVAKQLKNRESLTPQEKQTLQDYRDAKSAGLQTPELPDKLKAANERADAYAKAKQQNDIERAKLEGHPDKAARIEAQTPENYTHRETIGRGSNLERMMKGQRESPSSLGELGRETSSEHSRQLLNLTDENGGRHTFATEKGRVIKLENGGEKTTELGRFNPKTDTQRMQLELKPVNRKIAALEREKKVLSNVKTSGGVSEARVRNLGNKVAETGAKLETAKQLQKEAPNIAKEYMGSRLPEKAGEKGQTVKDLQDYIKKRGAQKGKSLAKTLNATKARANELANVSPVKVNATKRLQTIEKHLQDAYRQHANITNKYDMNTMEGKTFVDKNGTKYTIGQTTQSEALKNAGQKYYTDPELTNAIAYMDSQKALNNAKFIENTKRILSDKGLAMEKGTGTPTRGMVDGRKYSPYFQNYYINKKLAQDLKDVTGGAAKEESLPVEGLNKISNVLRQTIVYAPLKHNFNEAAGYFIDRGLSSWLNPAAYYRMGKSLGAATKSVVTHDQFWQDVQKSGFALKEDSKLGTVVKQQLKDTMSKPEQVALFAKTTKLNPLRAYRALQSVSVWDVQDVLNLARVHERMQGTLLRKPMSLEDAVKESSNYNFQYRVPSRIAGSRSASNLMNSKLVFFGHYKYDQYRIAKNIIKGSVNLSKPGKAVQAADKLAATVFIASAVWPLVDKGLQTVTGDKNAHMTAPGVAGVAELAQKVLTHKEGSSSIIGQISPNTAISIGTQLYDGFDSFNGQRIYDPNASVATKGEQMFNWMYQQLSPAEKLKSAGNATANKGLSTALSLLGVSMPKNSPEYNKLLSLQYDSLPSIQTEAKAAAKAGNTQKAIGIIAAYDAAVIKQAGLAAKAEGTQVPSYQQLKSAGLYYDPMESTVQKWAKNTPSVESNGLAGVLQTKVSSKAKTSKYVIQP